MGKWKGGANPTRKASSQTRLVLAILMRRSYGSPPSSSQKLNFLLRFLQMKKSSREFQDIYVGLVRLHVLHHASQEPIFGSGIISELARHGYRLGPGTIYPLLRSMERRGWLEAESKVANGRRRIHYRATRAGKAALQIGWERVRELFEEMSEGRDM